MGFTASELANLHNNILAYHAEQMRLGQEQIDEEGCGAIFAFEALYEDDGTRSGSCHEDYE